MKNDYKDFNIVDEDGDIIEVTFMNKLVCLTTGNDDYSVYVTKKDIGKLEKIVEYLKNNY